MGILTSCWRCGALYRPLRADLPSAGVGTIVPNSPNRPTRARPPPIPAKWVPTLAHAQRTQLTQGGSPVSNMTSTNGVLPFDASEIMTKKELAERLKVSVRSIENLHLPCLDMGHRLKRYVWSEVLAEIRKRRNGR